MQISARNLRETVTSVKLGGAMADVVVQAGGSGIVSVGTRTSAEVLGLNEGEGSA